MKILLLTILCLTSSPGLATDSPEGDLENQNSRLEPTPLAPPPQQQGATNPAVFSKERLTPSPAAAVIPPAAAVIPPAAAVIPPAAAVIPPAAAVVPPAAAVIPPAAAVVPPAAAVIPPAAAVIPPAAAVVPPAAAVVPPAAGVMPKKWMSPTTQDVDDNSPTPPTPHKSTAQPAATPETHADHTTSHLAAPPLPSQKAPPKKSSSVPAPGKFAELKLSAAQTTAIVEIRKTLKLDQEKALRDDVTTAKLDLAHAMIDNSASEEVRKKFIHLQKKYLELQTITFEKSLKIREVLNLDQRKKLQEIRNKTAEL